MKNTNTENTNNTITVNGLLLLADKAENMNAERYHELWELGKRELSREDQSILWGELSSRSIERKLGHFAGRKYRATHPEAAAPAKQEKKAKAKKTPAKQEKPKTAEAPAKQEKPAKAKEPTQKEVLANILTTLVSMDRRLTAIEKKLAD